MFSAPETEREPSPVRRPSWAEGVILVVLSALLVWLGVNPSPLIDIIESTVTRLT
jgi:NADH:ubiquinone oxidoreductase subunit 4 (subunit M)